ncbi:GNAT family protein [Mycolicibacter sp. MYC123]|uniref:GNAT family protein n=1 Tax=[Mycobacterium] zoologicum TaxID=2872311 RepID=A0ABU5YI07_9MYCO|nr:MULTISPECIES: GNAT family protein [unclassified Mycolicibacter]MEB3049685.1 GNAT family protein [Mycolicibacter sp. MYC123]MEB3063438.1 GNAT family protein [Mycolicibacter sp. MYC101]
MAIDHWTTTPTLRGERVLLRPTVLADVDGLARAYDVETTRYFLYGSQSGPPTEESVAEALGLSSGPSFASPSSRLAEPLASGRQVLTQIEIGTGEIVGTTSIYNMSEVHRRVTVGYTWLTSRVRGSAINSESKLLLFDHCFERLGAVRVELNVDEKNERSRRAVQAIGATEEGALRRHARRADGSWRTTMVYSVIDQEWPQVRARLVERINRRTR